MIGQLLIKAVILFVLGYFVGTCSVVLVLVMCLMIASRTEGSEDGK